MRSVLAILVLGATIALTGATAFAGGEEGGQDRTPTFQAPRVVVRAEPTTQITIAGPSKELPNWTRLRYDGRDKR